jgi:hypothetical protein
MNFNMVQSCNKSTYLRFKCSVVLIYCFIKVQYRGVLRVVGFSGKVKWRCKAVVTASSSLGDTRSK